MNLKTETGRSMVEMLGTLAIIGVLSIGGIAGYKYGMDKYRANQTINDVMLMGVDIITQLSQNRGTPTLSADWGTKTTAGYDFTVVPNPENETQYGIQITGVPSSICKMVGDGLKQTVAVYVGNEDYNSNTENDPCDESDNNTMEFYFDTGAVETDGCKTDAECEDGRYCDKNTGICLRGEEPVGTYGYPTCTSDIDCGDSGCARCSYGTCQQLLDYDGKSCSIDVSNDGLCQGGKCIKRGCTYEENKCEGYGVYCASPNNSDNTAFLDGETGICVNSDFTELTVDNKTYYISYHSMSWWDADAACKSIGKKLASLDLFAKQKTDCCDENNLTPLGKKIVNDYSYFVWTSTEAYDGQATFSRGSCCNSASRSTNHSGSGLLAFCE